MTQPCVVVQGEQRGDLILIQVCAITTIIEFAIREWHKSNPGLNYTMENDSFFSTPKMLLKHFHKLMCKQLPRKRWHRSDAFGVRTGGKAEE